VAWSISQTAISRPAGLLVVYIAFFAPRKARSSGFTWRSLSTSVRAKGQGVGSASHWILVALIVQFFRWWRTGLARARHSSSSPPPRHCNSCGHFLLSGDQGQTLEQLQRRLVKD